MKEKKIMNYRKRNNKKKKKKAPTICLFVDELQTHVVQSLYIIEPTLDSVQMVAFEYDRLRVGPGMVNYGSKIYFLGGEGVEVHVFDTNKPYLGIQYAAPLHTPKELPCVFVADNMIYALAARPIDVEERLITTGCFERYNPITNCWTTLPDPPPTGYLPCFSPIPDRLKATVVGPRVFITPSYLVFNLDTLKWDPPLPPSLAFRFPFYSVFDGAFLYYLRGYNAWNTIDFLDHQRYAVGESAKVVKRGPLPSPLPHAATLLKLPCFEPGTAMDHVVTSQDSNVLDPKVFFHSFEFLPWKSLFHMGGRFFCSVVTANLVDFVSDIGIARGNSRGITVKFFEASEQTSKFRTLASFSYEIDTNFVNHSHSISCCVLGSIPQSWINAPLGNKLQKGRISVHEGSALIPMEMEAERKDYNPEQSLHELKDVNRKMEDGNTNMELLEEINRLKDELSRTKDELSKVTLAGLV